MNRSKSSDGANSQEWEYSRHNQESICTVFACFGFCKHSREIGKFRFTSSLSLLKGAIGYVYNIGKKPREEKGGTANFSPQV